LPADQLEVKQLDHGFEYFEPERLKGIDAAVVVARSQIPEFQRWFGPDKVVYVPHGIDTTRFRPKDDTSDCDDLRLLIVGLWLRDWEVIHRVIDEVRNCHLKVKFDVVTLTEFFPYFTGCSNVTLHSGIPESQLIELYQRSDALFMPLKDATANNAVLEALACGVPVIATDVGGIPDYVSKDSGWLIPKGDVEAPLTLIKQLCADKNIARSRRERARMQALQFDWQRVAERLFGVYAAVSAGRSPSTAVAVFEATLLDG
jgi:glycosyltransferase involved in cell wall biosynthesis